MNDELQSFFFSGEFLPHGQCLLWQSGLVWLHVISDTLITLAYYSIPLTLGYFVYNRRDLAFSWMFLLFGVFIFACGTTHLMNIWTLWQPAYWLDGLIKLMTAGVSVTTAFLLVPLVPKALDLPSPAQLEATNQALRKEVVERERAQEALMHHAQDLACANSELERFNRSAVGREQRMMELKQEVNELLHKAGRQPAYDLSSVQEEHK